MIKKINRQERQELTGLSKTQINRIFKQASFRVSFLSNQKNSIFSSFSN
jgi:hypothetical protein